MFDDPDEFGDRFFIGLRQTKKNWNKTLAASTERVRVGGITQGKPWAMLSWPLRATEVVSSQFSVMSKMRVRRHVSPCVTPSIENDNDDEDDYSSGKTQFRAISGQSDRIDSLQRHTEYADTPTRPYTLTVRVPDPLPRCQYR
jgi:hypothetical protein